jgi:hypothetical protein
VLNQYFFGTSLPCAKILPCAKRQAHGKEELFAVCFFMQHTANAHLCRVLDLCRVYFLLTHDKEKVCRVPDVCRVLFLLAHGKG